MSASRPLTVYSVATGLQYINSADDSARGKINNPFDPATNALAPKIGGGDGPVAGDIAIYSVDLYSDSTLKRHAGSGVYTCYFNYAQHALCQAYYKPGTGGTIVASGPVDFNASGFTIVITGGTNTYLGARGQVDVGSSKNDVGIARKKGAQRVDFQTSVPVAAASGSTGAATQKRTVYAVPATVQFMNHADDRLRGMSSNPFNLKAQTVIFNDNGKEKGNGPFPGDDILYAFKLFADAKRTQPTGTAIFTCYYGFGKHATCDSYFDLAQGLLLASGQVPFGTAHFTLGVTGGTHAYLGALGQLSAVPAAKNAQRFDLQVTASR